MRKIIVDEIMEKLDTSLAINASMEAGKKLMAAVQEEIDAVACFQIAPIGAFP